MIAAFPNISNVFCVLRLYFTSGTMVPAGFAACTHRVVLPHTAPPVQTKGKCPCSALVRSLHLFLAPRVTNVYTWSLSCTDYSEWTAPPATFCCVSTDHIVTGLWLAKDTRTVFRAAELNPVVDFDLSQKAAMTRRIQRTFTDDHCTCCTAATQHLQHFAIYCKTF